MDVLRIKLIN